MRSHAEIVKAAGPDALAELLSASIHTVRSWIQRDSIPPEHWARLVSDGQTTLEELADGVKPRSRKAAA